MGCVYLVTNTISGKQYVGKTVKSLRSRRAAHKHDALVKYDVCPAFHRALRRYGFDAFKWERLYRGDDNEKLIEREIFYIKLLNSRAPNGYNLTDGGDGANTLIDPDVHAKMCLIQKEVQNRPDVKAKKKRSMNNIRDAVVAAQTEIQNRPDIQERRRANVLVAVNTPEARAKKLASMRKTLSDPEVSRRRKEKAKEVHNRPEVRKKHSEASRAVWELRRKLSKVA